MKPREFMTFGALFYIPSSLPAYSGRGFILTSNEKIILITDENKYSLSMSIFSHGVSMVRMYFPENCFAGIIAIKKGTSL